VRLSRCIGLIGRVGNHNVPAVSSNQTAVLTVILTLLYKDVPLVWKCFGLTWLASLHVSHHSLRGKQIRFPVVQPEAPKRCADGAVSVDVRPRKSTHGMQHATVR
jgi:hypothetical protein